MPIWIDLAFAGITLVSVLLFLRAARGSWKMIAGVAAWLALIGALAVEGFFLDTSGLPPRFALTLGPPMLLTVLLFLTPGGRSLLNGLDGGTLTLLHTVRLPVELLLYQLFLRGAIPELMTFSGRNWDILSGISAPVIWYLGFRRQLLPHWCLVAWNLLCLGLLINIVGNAILAAPFDFQTQAFDQPNIGVLYFPYVWLPALVVPLVLLSHLAVLRQLSGGGAQVPRPTV